MIEYIKEYGVTDADYANLMHELKMEYIELMGLYEVKIREVLNYYNSLGLREEIANIIRQRPDLIITSKENIASFVDQIEPRIFVNIVRDSLEDLIILGL